MPESGSLREDLRRLIAASPFFDESTPDVESTAALVVEAVREPRVLERFRADDTATREVARKAFDRASARGEIRADVDVDLALDMLSGMLFARTVTGQAMPRAQALEAILDLVLRGIALR